MYIYRSTGVPRGGEMVVRGKGEEENEVVNKWERLERN